MNQKELDEFEKLAGQIQSIYDEVSLLSKRSPNDAINSFKLSFINKLIASANQLLGAAYRPFEDFSQFDSENVPFNSDVVLILAQYLQCFEKLRADNVVFRTGNWYWAIQASRKDGADEKGFIYVKTVTPQRLR